MTKHCRNAPVDAMLILFSALLLLTGCRSPNESETTADEAEVKAEQAIKSNGGEVIRDEELKGKPIVCVRLRDVTDAGLKDLSALKDLQVLDLARSKVTDAGLRSSDKTLVFRKCPV